MEIKINRKKPTLRQIVRNLANVQLMRRRVSSQKGQVTKLTKKVAELNHLIKDDVLALLERTRDYVGNAYTTYKSAVEAINEKYNGTADWGVLQTGNIIDLRAAFIIGEGPKVVKKVEGADAEVEWAEKFFEYNNIDNEVAQEFAKEAEIEGKIAIKLVVEDIKDAKEGDQKQAVSARYVSWTENNYKIIPNPKDYMQYEKMVWLPTGKSKAETLKENEFVYKKFGGRINKPNLAAPKMMKCLTQIEDLDRALRDWREIDRVFAAPILAVECETPAQVKSAQDALSSKNWKLKKIFISTAKLYYAQFDIKGVESLENEIMTLAKMISGTTGVPLQALGLPEFMGQGRATADNLMEFVYAATIKERETWIGAYEEMIAKGMAMFNAETGKTPLDHRKIGIEIPMITEKHWQHLKDIYLEAAIAGKISDEAFQEKIPNFDMKVEKKRREEKEKSEFERIKKENENLKIDQSAQGRFGQEEEE